MNSENLYFEKLLKLRKPFLISGPCVIESKDHCLYMAEKIKEITDELSIEYIFKASFDKANRTKLANFRGLNNFENSLEVFQSIKDNFGVKVLLTFMNLIKPHCSQMLLIYCKFQLFFADKRTC